MNFQITTKIALFFCAFLFIQMCEIYIMGGFEYQTIKSKFISITLGIVFGLLATAAPIEER